MSDLQVYAETANRRDPDRSTCDINEILQEVSLSLHATITESGAELISAGLPIVSANRRQMLQLFQNLIANAIKYRGPSAPRIEIGAIHEAHEWVFHLRDNGIGFEMRYAIRFSAYSKGCTAGKYLGRAWVWPFANKSWSSTTDGFGPNPAPAAARHSLSPCPGESLSGTLIRCIRFTTSILVPIVPNSFG